jgi:hypothetical protein
MTNEPAALTAGDDLAAGRAPAGVARGPLVPGAGVLAALALAWLAAMLWTSQGTVGRAAEGNDIALVSAALALPGVISAALVGGAAVGLAGVNLLAAGGGPAAVRAVAASSACATAWPWRLAAGGGAGMLTGLAMAVPIAIGYDGLPSIVVLAVTVGAVAAIGGGLAAVPQVRVVAAGVTGALGVFAITLLLNIFSHDLLDLYGAGETGESRYTANAWLALTVSLLSGLVAGVLGYAYLRRRPAGVGGQPARWPAYLVAGALPGLLTLLAEVVTRLGGAHLFRLASAVSADDSAYLRYLNTARINRAMVILFVGALTAMVLFGRTLRPAEPADPDKPAEPADPDKPAEPADADKPAEPAEAADPEAAPVEETHPESASRD